MKSSERAANSPNFPWIRSWHFNERKDNVWNKASSGFLPSMCHSNSTSCPSTQHFILFRPPKSPLNTFSDSWGSSCQHVFPASGTQWLWTGPRKFCVCVCFVLLLFFYEWLSQGTLTPAQSYPAIHKKQRENIVLCPVGNCLWYWPRLSRILVIQDLRYHRLHVERSLAALADCRLGFHWIWDLEFSVCYAFFLKWKQHGYESWKAGLSPPASMNGAPHRHAGNRAHSCHAKGSSLWLLNPSQVLVFRSTAFLAAAWESYLDERRPDKSSQIQSCEDCSVHSPRSPQTRRMEVCRDHEKFPKHPLSSL